MATVRYIDFWLFSRNGVCMADMDIRSDMETSTDGYGRNARDHRWSRMWLMHASWDDDATRDQDGQRCNGYIDRWSRRCRPPDDDIGTTMALEMDMDPEDIRKIRADIGDGASDRTTTGTMTSNIHRGEMSVRNLVWCVMHDLSTKYMLTRFNFFQFCVWEEIRWPRLR